FHGNSVFGQEPAQVALRHRRKSLDDCVPIPLSDGGEIFFAEILFEAGFLRLGPGGWHGEIGRWRRGARKCSWRNYERQIHPAATRSRDNQFPPDARLPVTSPCRDLQSALAAVRR